MPRGLSPPHADRLRGTIQLKLSSFALRGFDLVVLGANLLVRISSITI